MSQFEKRCQYNEGLEGIRLPQFRIELSSGSSGTLDSVTVDGTELLDPDGGGADVITYATSLANTAKLIAAKINAGTALHGWFARTGIASSLSEVFCYKSVPGAITGAVVLGATTLVVDFKYPAAAVDNVVYGDTDSYVDLPLATPLAADDYGAIYAVRVKDGPAHKVLKVQFLVPVSLLIWDKYSVSRCDPVNGVFHNLSSIEKPNGMTIPANVPIALPIEDWFAGTTTGQRIIGTDVVAGINSIQYALLTR